MKMSMFKMALFAALAQNLMMPQFNAGVRPKNDSVAYRPKRTKLKGWQK